MASPAAGGEPEFQAKLASFVKDNRVYGAAAGVVHGHELAWAGGAGFADASAGRPSTPSTLYRIASVTKTFTGTAIMQLRDAGALGLDDPAVRWLGELAASASPTTIEQVTIRRLLSHESGLVSEPPGTDWVQSPPVYEGMVQRNLARVAEIFTAVPPNTQPKYSNLGYQLLGEIVHRASGAEYSDYVRQRILEPLKMSATAFEPLSPALAARRATGYRVRTFSDELATAPDAPQVWAEGGLWSDVQDMARWLSFQLSAHADEPVESPVLAGASLREMHKPRYLSDEAWTSAWGITWYAARQDDVTWIQHGGGLPGFSACICFDRAARVGAIALVNGSAPASSLAMELGCAARRLARASPPAITLPAPVPEEFRQLLGSYASATFAVVLRLEWRDGKLTFVDPSDPAWRCVLEPAGQPDTFTIGPGLRQSGELARFRRLPDGRFDSVLLGPGTWLRLGPAGAEPAER